MIYVRCYDFLWKMTTSSNNDMFCTFVIVDTRSAHHDHLP